MLKITERHEDASRARLQLEGRIVREWAHVLERECLRHPVDKRPVLLDCSAVTYLDRDGIDVVTRLVRDDVVEVLDCPEFVRQLLAEGDRKDKS